MWYSGLCPGIENHIGGKNSELWIKSGVNSNVPVLVLSFDKCTIAVWATKKRGNALKFSIFS